MPEQEQNVDRENIVLDSQGEPTREIPINDPGEELPVQYEPVSSDPGDANRHKRNTHGLFDDVSYVYNPDGSVNWLAMIPKEYFVINKQATTETNIDNVDDKNKLILLAGFKYLASLRGYISEHTDVVVASPDYVAMSTNIRWMPNFETNGYAIDRSGKADAHPGNVSTKKAPNGFVATNFLMTIAENRSFVRAVKNFLKISVLGQDEVSLSEDNPSATTPEPEQNNEARKILQKLLSDNEVPFDRFKNAITHYVSKGQLKGLASETWEVIDDIPNDRLFELTKFFKERVEEKKAKK